MKTIDDLAFKLKYGYTLTWAKEVIQENKGKRNDNNSELSSFLKKLKKQVRECQVNTK